MKRTFTASSPNRGTPEGKVHKRHERQPKKHNCKSCLCLFAGLIPFVFSLPLMAQWLDYPTRGVPRTADGKTDLNAPAPHTADGKPDFSWMSGAASRLPCDGINRVC